jgi:hypothetical protein
MLALLFGAVPVHAAPGSIAKQSLSADRQGDELLQTTTGTIVLVKDTVPDDPQDFTFQLTPTGGGQVVDDDPTNASASRQFTRTIEAGTYTATENAVTGWIVTAVTCDDPSSSGNAANRTATIDLDPGETVTCTFTNEPDLSVPRGTLVIVKDAVPDDPQDFRFTIPGIHTTFLDDDPGSSDPTNQYSATVVAKTYTATEDDVTGWDLTALTCTDPDNGSSTDLAARRATLDIDAGETVTCTFRNEPAALGTIRVIKDAIPDDPQNFELQLFTASGTGAGGVIVDDDPGSATPNEFSITREAGAYTARENAVSGWTLTALTCDDPDNGSSGDISTRTATIDLDGNETVTCTFTNTKDGVDPTPPDVTIDQASGQQDPTSASPINFIVEFSEPVTGFSDTDVSLSGTAGATTAVVTGSGATYNVAVSGMTQSGTVIAAIPANAAIDVANNGNTASTSTDNTVTFTVTPTTGTIIIVKDAQPNDPQDFTFFNDLQVAAFFLDDDSDPTLSNRITFTDVVAGFHTVEEDQNPPGWNLTDITCDDPDNGSSTSLNTRLASIDLDAGETVTCTFTNTQQVQQSPDLTISKSHTGDFTQGQTGAQYAIAVSNVGPAAASGAVTVVDTLPAGLTATALNGAGWICTLATLTCTRSDALAVSTSYPNIILSVNVASNAPSSLTNSATVSGGGEQNTGNNTANDPTMINPTAAGPMCNGQTATIYVNAQGRIVGGSDNGKRYKGELRGTNGADVIVGTDDEDEIDGKGGDDILCGGDDDDELEGGSGNDQLLGEAGKDKLESEGGNDILVGGDGNDELEGGSGNDQLLGEAGKDKLKGEDGNDTLTGGSEADKFDGGRGADTATDFTPTQGDTRTKVENF